MRPRHLKGPVSATVLSVLTSTALLPAPAQAFDCARASTRIEKAICADNTLKAADDAMAAAYTALVRTLADARAKTMRRAQIHWVKQREERCGHLEGAALSQCILGETEARARFLEARPQAGPGPGAPMLPLASVQDAAPQHYAIDITAVRFAAPDSPGQHLFNAKVDAAMAQAPFGRQKDFPSDRQLFYELDISVTYASPRLISATTLVFRYDGGAHPNSTTRMINIDLQAGAELTFGRLFKPAARAALSKTCRAQLTAEKKERFGDDFDVARDIAEHAGAIAAHVADLSRWAFHGGEASVRFDAYEVGSYAEGAYVCSFSYDELRPYAEDPSLLPD